MTEDECLEKLRRMETAHQEAVRQIKRDFWFQCAITWALALLIPILVVLLVPIVSKWMS